MQEVLPSSVQDPQTSAYHACLARLAEALDEHDDTHLDEVASLIGQLAVVIEV